MVSNRRGRVEYAVLTFGGFLGLGDDYHSLPWDALAYDPDKGGYVTDITSQTLEQAPRYSLGEEPLFDRSYGERVYGTYGLGYPPY
jgi:hypothetical protein